MSKGPILDPQVLQSGVGVNYSIWSGEIFNSVHTWCSVKTSGFTRSVCKNR